MLGSQKLSEIIDRDNIESIFQITTTNEIGKVNDFNEIKSSDYFDLLKYLICEGFIDETYPDYMTYFYENSLSRNDKVFLRSVTDQRAKGYTYRLQKPEMIMKRLRLADFEKEETLNFDLLYYMLQNQSASTRQLIKMVKQLESSKKYDFIIRFMEGRREAETFIRILNSQWPQMFGRLLEESGYSDEQKKYMAIMSLYHSPKEDLEKVDIGSALSNFISHCPDFLQIEEPQVEKLLKGQRVNGFNSMFAVSSIAVCKKYYLELKKQIVGQHREMTIATIFSFAPNEADTADGILDDESFDTDGLDQSSRDFLEMAIDDYNKIFKTNFDTSSKGFQDYYKDLSDKVKKREVDLLIVVNMFLTGFDATTLNTLWVDKNLKMHGLIQAFSRTNRILNSVKSFGNIVCFRDLEEATNDAITLFGDKDAGGIVLLKSYEDYYYGYVDDKGRELKGYEERVAQLLALFPLGQPIIGEQNKKDFIILFGNILRLRNILSAFDRFAGNEILSPIDFQDYTGTYHDVYDEIKPKQGSKDSIMDDIVFEMELVKQVEVNIDYILMLVAKYHDSNCEDKEILIAIDKAIKSSLQLRSKKELIENFIAAINTGTDINADWQRFVKEQREADIQALINEERLKSDETRKFVENAFRDGILKTTGIDIDRLMPPVSRFSGGGSRDQKKQTIIEKLKTFFEKYFGLVSAELENGAEKVTYLYDVPETLSMVAEKSSYYGEH